MSFKLFELQIQADNWDEESISRLLFDYGIDVTFIERVECQTMLPSKIQEIKRQ